MIAADGQRLLAAVDAAELSWIREMPAVGVLRRTWQEQYVERAGKLVWRDKEEMASPAELVHSPYDPEARYSRKRGIEWIGQKVRLTDDLPPENYTSNFVRPPVSGAAPWLSPPEASGSEPFAGGMNRPKLLRGLTL